MSIEPNSMFLNSLEKIYNELCPKQGKPPSWEEFAKKYGVDATEYEGKVLCQVAVYTGRRLVYESHELVTKKEYKKLVKLNPEITFLRCSDDEITRRFCEVVEEDCDPDSITLFMRNCLTKEGTEIREFLDELAKRGDEDEEKEESSDEEDSDEDEDESSSEEEIKEVEIKVQEIKVENEGEEDSEDSEEDEDDLADDYDFIGE